MASSGDTLTIAIRAEEHGLRLDKVLVTRVAGLGRAGARQLFARGQVERREGARRLPAGKGDRAGAGQLLTVKLAGLDRRARPDPSLPLVIVDESPHWVVIDKQAGVPSAPLQAGELGTAANGLVARYPEMAAIGYGPREPGLCHRLDTGTSGLLVAARTQRAFEILTRAIRNSQLDKRYLLLCHADGLAQSSGRIDYPLIPHPRDSRRVQWLDPAAETPPANARPSTTHYRVSARHGDLLLVEARASRAYRHQLRVHFAAIGAPLIGDTLYGGPPHPKLKHHALHACRIRWRGNAQLPGFDVRSALPPRLAALL